MHQLLHFLFAHNILFTPLAFENHLEMAYLSQMSNRYKGQYHVGRYEYQLGENKLHRIDQDGDTLLVTWDQDHSVVFSSSHNPFWPEYRTVRNGIFLTLKKTNYPEEDAAAIDSLVNHYHSAYDSLYAISIQKSGDRYFTRYSVYQVTSDTSVVIKDIVPLLPDRQVSHEVSIAEYGFVIQTRDNKGNLFRESRYDNTGKLRYRRQFLFEQEHIATFRYEKDKLMEIHHDQGSEIILTQFHYTDSNLLIQKDYLRE